MAAHLLAVLPELGGEALTIGGVGKHSLANVADDPTATLVWPPQSGRLALVMAGRWRADRRHHRQADEGDPHRPAVDTAGKRTGRTARCNRSTRSHRRFAARLCRPVAVPLAANTPMEITWGSWTSGLSFRRGGR